MKKLSMNSWDGRRRLGWRLPLLATLVLCTGFAATSRGGSSGGETVGTLPSTGGSGAGLRISHSFRDAQPTLFLEGQADQIFELIVGLSGRAVITEEVVDASSQTVRLTFHGNLNLELDRQAFERSTIAIGWSVPQAFGPARTTMLLGGRTIAAGITDSRNVLLPIRAVDSSGGLDSVPFSIVSNGRQGHHARLDVFASGDQLILSQTH